MNRLSLLAGLALVGAAAAPALAQTCQGYTPFAVAPLRVQGDLQFGDNTTLFGAGISAGQAKPGLFGGASVAGIKYDGSDQTVKAFGVGGGFSVPMAAMPNLEFCPVASYSHLSADGGSANNFSLGGAIGRSIATSPTMAVVPFADLRWVHQSSDGFSDSWGELGIGAGIVFSKTLTLRPSLIIPVAHDGASTGFAVSLGYNFGK